MRCRSVIVLALLATLVAVPAIACLPNPVMTKAEMECCKKMMGDCTMGAGKHPCCRTVRTAPTPVASVQAKVQFHPVIAFVAQVHCVESDPGTEANPTLTHVGLPPPAPPGTDSILRI